MVPESSGPSAERCGTTWGSSCAFRLFGGEKEILEDTKQCHTVTFGVAAYRNTVGRQL